MTFVVYTAPATEPVSVTEAKVHARISGTASDAEVGVMIKAARQYAEAELRRYIITQTVDAYFDAFPEYFELPPLQSVTSITYVDTNGDTQTLAADQYRVDSKTQPARITEAYGISWPSTQDVTNAVTVRFVAGYGTADAVPECVKHWILMRVGHYFDNRGPNVVGDSIAQFAPSYVDGLLDPERVTSRV
jgi:uncharacterized phiE125 gp8 family phage protein